MPETKATRSDVDGGANGHDGSNGHGSPKPEIPLSKLGVLLFVGSLAVIFLALAGAYLYRLDDKANYRFPVPPSLWASTFAIIVSSLTLYVAQRAARAGLIRKVAAYMGLTLALAWVFVVSQIVSWLLLRHAGFYAQTNPIAAFFYLLTSIHGFHLLAGIGWLVYVFSLAKHGEITGKKHLALELFSVYWHFMTVGWLVFFVLIVI